MLLSAYCQCRLSAAKNIPQYDLPNYALASSPSVNMLGASTKLLAVDVGVGNNEFQLGERRAGRGWHRVGSPARIHAKSRVREPLESSASLSCVGLLATKGPRRIQ